MRWRIKVFVTQLVEIGILARRRRTIWQADSSSNSVVRRLMEILSEDSAGSRDIECGTPLEHITQGVRVHQYRDRHDIEAS